MTICSWAIIASKFKDKTTRQCRRRYGFWILMMIHSSYFIRSSALILWLMETFKPPAQFWSSIWCLSEWCFARWYTYLNSDFKKGGWSPEEDMLLCEVNGCFLCSLATLLYHSSCHSSLTSLFYNSDLTKYLEILNFILYCLFSVFPLCMVDLNPLIYLRIASAVIMAVGSHLFLLKLYPTTITLQTTESNQVFLLV